MYLINRLKGTGGKRKSIGDMIPQRKFFYKKIFFDLKNNFFYLILRVIGGSSGVIQD